MRTDIRTGTLMRLAADGGPVFIAAQLGINHNGSLDLARKLIEGAQSARCDAIQFRKQSLNALSAWERDRRLETPEGILRGSEFYKQVDFDKAQTTLLIETCHELSIGWFPYCYDRESVDFFRPFDPPLYQINLSEDQSLLGYTKRLGKPVILVSPIGTDLLLERALPHLNGNSYVAHTSDKFPASPENLSLKRIAQLRKRYPEMGTGYMGREVGLVPSYAAVAQGATFIERAITLDRALWGPEQAASVEVYGMRRLVSHIRDVELSLKDYAEEHSAFVEAWAASTIH
jgi:N-acetylneuraminate synthase